MTDIDSSSEILRRLVTLVTENGLTELTVEQNGLIVTVRVDAVPSSDSTSIVAPSSLHSSAQKASSLHAMQPTRHFSQATTRAASKPATRIALESPMVGIFYRSPSPEDPPFVHVGDTLEVGQTIGLIEAMKVYSEIPSEIAGIIVEIPAHDGKLVQQGQALIYVEPE